MTLPSLDRWIFVVRSLGRHLLRFFWLYLLIVAGFIWLHAHIRIAVNVTESLPNRFFLVVLGERPAAVGEYVAFEWRRDKFYAPDWTFIKRVAGTGGQTITVKDRNVFVDGHPVGYAKPRSKRGTALEPIEAGVIPAGYFYAEAPNPDSLDSRYAVTGLVEPNRVVGRAYAIF